MCRQLMALVASSRHRITQVCTDIRSISCRIDNDTTMEKLHTVALFETPNSNIIDVIGIEQDELSARERPEQSMKHNPSGLPPHKK